MRCLIPILLFFLLLSSVAAQEETPLPVLNAEDIFAEGVTVLERLPRIEFDWENRLVYYFNPETQLWSSYPYLDEIVRINRYEERSDGTYILQRGNDDNGRLRSYEDEWLFDPSAETISRENLYCGRIAALPNEGEWFLYRLETEQYVLCNSETGQQIALPDSLQSELDCGNYPGNSSQSPDRGEWVVIYDCTEINRYFAINTQTQEAVFLGQFEANGLPYFRWLDADTIILYEDNALGGYRVHAAKVSQANSLSIIWEDPSIFQENQLIWYEVQEDESDVYYRAYRYDALSDSEINILNYRCAATRYDCMEDGYAVLSPNSSYIAMSSLGGLGTPINCLIFDIQSQSPVMEIPFRAEHMEWLSIDMLMIQAGNHLYLVDISSQNIRDIEMPISGIGQLQISFDMDSLLLRSPEAELFVYNLSNDEWYSIIQNNYRAYSQWQENGDMIVEVLNESCQLFPCFGGAWHIQIDALSGENS